MAEERPFLFDRRKYAGVAAQTYHIEPPTAEQSITKILPAYFVYLQGGQYSKYTPADFTSDIKKFGLFAKDRPIQSIAITDVQQWLGALKKTMSAKTISRKISALNNYFAWLEGQGIVSAKANPMQSVLRRRVTSPLPDVLYESEAKQLKAAASHDPRMYLLVLLLLETGMKKAELFNLKVAHFDFSDRYSPELWLKHSGKQVAKDRKLKLPTELVSAFSDYLQRYHVVDVVFPYTPRMIELILAEAGQRAGLKKKITASLLRDAFVVLSVKRGAKMEDVLKKIGLTANTWDDARKKYGRLTREAV